MMTITWSYVTLTFEKKWANLWDEYIVLYIKIYLQLKDNQIGK